MVLCIVFLLFLQGLDAVAMKNLAQIESPDLLDLKDAGREKRSEHQHVAGLVTELRTRLENLERRASEQPLYRNKRSEGDSCDCQEAVEDVLLNEGGSIDMTECYTSMDGSDYRGRVSETESGLSCQNWAEQSPHEHNTTLAEFADAGIGNHSYCRNPDGSAQPWCYTTDPGTEREDCDVGRPDETCEPRVLTWTGVTYIRYGVSECPSGNELVYEGFVGGTLSTHEGGGADFLCMPHEPIYERLEEGVQDARAYVFHTEYRDPVMPGGLNNGDVPCAVCRVPTQSSILMVPARNTCPDETWTLQYKGYLGAQSVAIRRHSSEFICLDRRSKKIAGSQRPVDGTLVFNVEGRCSPDSAMPCDGPYIDGHELTCAVCTK
ncbi:plasminogen-like [Ptychodera flava]|uniref:plasminogen-like n=1 Tax=Ptychodera flava TaxID=63121 RepID=UPI00396A3655